MFSRSLRVIECPRLRPGKMRPVTTASFEIHSNYPTPSASGDAGRKLVLLAAVAALVVAMPLLPAEWRSVTHFSGVGNRGQGELGKVTVATCSRGALLVNWTCRGRFEVNDSMAEPYPSMDDVTVVNDGRHHARGEQVDATKSLSSHEAYRWGGLRQLRVVALWAGVVLCLAAAVLALGRRRGSVALPLATVAAGVAAVLAGTYPLW